MRAAAIVEHVSGVIHSYRKWLGRCGLESAVLHGCNLDDVERQLETVRSRFAHDEEMALDWSKAVDRAVGREFQRLRLVCRQLLFHHTALQLLLLNTSLKATVVILFPLLEPAEFHSQVDVLLSQRKTRFLTGRPALVAAAPATRTP